MIRARHSASRSSPKLRLANILERLPSYRYYMSGNCLAGDTCLFSHDPSALMARMVIADASTPPLQAAVPDFQPQDYSAFPALQGTNSPQWHPAATIGEATSLEQLYGLTAGVTHPPPGLSPFPTFTPGTLSLPQSRPGSRHHSRATTPSVPAVDDNEAFPSLGSAAAKPGKRHHGKRGGHGHNGKEQPTPNNLADVVRMSPSPNPLQPRKGLRTAKSFNGSRENSVAAQAIPAPEHIPWLETGDAANKAYLQARAEAFKHGSLRNKFLQRCVKLASAPPISNIFITVRRKRGTVVILVLRKPLAFEVKARTISCVKPTAKPPAISMKSATRRKGPTHASST